MSHKRNVESGKGGEPIAAGTRFCPHFHKACLTKSQAKSLAKRSSRKSGLNVTPYECRTCGKWHVGTKRTRPA